MKVRLVASEPLFASIVGRSSCISNPLCSTTKLKSRNSAGRRANYVCHRRCIGRRRRILQLGAIQQSATIIGSIVSIFARNWAVSEALAQSIIAEKTRLGSAALRTLPLACNSRQQVEFIKYNCVNLSFQVIRKLRSQVKSKTIAPSLQLVIKANEKNRFIVRKNI